MAKAKRKPTRKPTTKRKTNTRKPKAARQFAAAKHNRLTNDWRVSYGTIDQDVMAAIRILRARARDLVHNNPHAQRFIRLMQMNVPGPHGFKLHSNVTFENGKPDESANNLIEREFRRWARRGTCEVTGRHSFRGLQHLLIAHAARDGEFMVREIIDPTRPFGYALQVIEPDLLDDAYNDRLPNGNVVVMGVEMNTYREPVAYWIKDFGFETIQDYTQPAQNRTRIPANQIIHGYVSQSAYQTRGITWFHAAMLKLRMLGEYELAAVTKARVGATSLGFLIPSTDNPVSLQTGEVDVNDNIVVSTEPMSVTELDPGMKFEKWDSEYPSAQFEAFTKSILRSIATGIDVSYTSLSGDLSEANYSSARVGLLDEREAYKDKQEWMVEHLMQRVFRSWLQMAMAAGVINLPFSKFDKYADAMWIGRRWAWVDPQKDMNAATAEIQANLSTATAYSAERGRDYVETLRERAHEKELEREILGAPTQPAPPPTKPDGSKPAAGAGAAASKALATQSGNGHEE